MKTTAKDIDVDLARELFSYDPKTGVITRRVATRKSRAGTVAGCVHSRGYLAINVGRRMVLAHRLAWVLHYGRNPTALVDHINQDKKDNRINNLREATPAQSSANVPAWGGLCKGVTKVGSRFRAKMTVAGKSVHLGYYDTPEEANEAYFRSAQRLHGEFASNGRP